MQTKIFEALMIVSFGAAWPFSVYKSYKARTAKGKSLTFLLALIFGYICGIINNLIHGANYVLFFYSLNLVLITADLVLFFRNKALDKKREANQK